MIDVLRKSAWLVGRHGRRRWLCLAVAATVVSVVEAFAALLVFALLTLLTSSGETEMPLVGTVGGSGLSLTAVALVGIAFFVFRGCLNVAQSYLQNRIVHGQGVAVSKRLLDGYLAMPYEFHVRRDSAQSIRNAYETVTLWVNQVVLPCMTMASEGLIGLGFLVILFITAPWATAGAFAFLGPVFWLILRSLRPRLLAYGVTTQARSQDCLQALQHVFEGLREIKVASRHEFFSMRFANARWGYARARALGATLSDLPRFLIESLLIIFVLGFLAVSHMSDSARAGESLAVLGLFGYSALRLLPSMNRIVVSLGQIRLGSAAAIDLYDDTLATESARLAVQSLPPARPESMRLDDVLQLQSISFRYAGSDREVLQDVSLEVLAGAFVGVVGSTGSGKSTLLDVLAGLVTPTSGQVLADGASIHSDLRAWQSGVALVSQSIFLLDDSLRRNVAFGLHDEDIDEGRVAWAVTVSQLDEVIAFLPHGIETVVGERGTYLSGGQRQRLGIARALYRDASLLLLDEATSALDQRTETEFLGALNGLRGTRTVIMVTHRLRTIEKCDWIALIEAGRLVDVGSYGELIGRSRQFQELASTARRQT